MKALGGELLADEGERAWLLVRGHSEVNNILNQQRDLVSRDSLSW